MVNRASNSPWDVSMTVRAIDVAQAVNARAGLQGSTL